MTARPTRTLQNEKGGNLNERSAMLMVRYGGASLLLTADIGNDSQAYFAKEPGAGLKADILKAPHHGLEDLRGDFLRHAAPELSFITHGKSNTRRMQRTLQKNGIPFLIATQGIIHLATGGETWYAEQLHQTARHK